MFQIYLSPQYFSQKTYLFFVSLQREKDIYKHNVLFISRNSFFPWLQEIADSANRVFNRQRNCAAFQQTKRNFGVEHCLGFFIFLHVGRSLPKQSSYPFPIEYKAERRRIVIIYLFFAEND